MLAGRQAQMQILLILVQPFLRVIVKNEPFLMPAGREAGALSSV